MQSPRALLLAAGVIWGLATACTSSDSLPDGTEKGGESGAGGSATGGVAPTGGSRQAGVAGVGQGGRISSSGGRSSSSGGAGALAGASSGGSALAGASSGGSAAAGEAGSSGSEPCPPGEVWCPGCTAGSGQCRAGGCPGAACSECADVTTLEECETRTDCHSVFVDEGNCGCALAGCCARFQLCAPGDEADCDVASIQCDALTPFCDSPAYVVSVSGSCYEGCVDPKDCAASPPSSFSP